MRCLFSLFFLALVTSGVRLGEEGGPDSLIDDGKHNASLVDLSEGLQHALVVAAKTKPLPKGFACCCTPGVAPETCTDVSQTYWEGVSTSCCTIEDVSGNWLSGGRKCPATGKASASPSNKCTVMDGAAPTLQRSNTEKMMAVSSYKQGMVSTIGNFMKDVVSHKATQRGYTVLKVVAGLTIFVAGLATGGAAWAIAGVAFAAATALLEAGGALIRGESARDVAGSLLFNVVKGTVAAVIGLDMESAAGIPDLAGEIANSIGLMDWFCGSVNDALDDPDAQVTLDKGPLMEEVTEAAKDGLPKASDASKFPTTQAFWSSTKNCVTCGTKRR